MRADDELILEAVGALQKIIQVHVAELVNLLPEMIGPDEAQLGDEDLSLEDGRAAIQSRGAGVAGVSNERCPHFTRHRRSCQPQISDLLAGQPQVLLLQL